MTALTVCTTDHITEFDKESVMDMLGDPISGDAIDSSLVIFDKVWKAFMFIFLCFT